MVEPPVETGSVSGCVRLDPSWGTHSGARLVAAGGPGGPESYGLLTNGARARIKAIPRNPSIRLGAVILLPPLERPDGSVVHRELHGSNSYRTRLRLPTVALFEVTGEHPADEPCSERHWDVGGGYRFENVEPGSYVLCVHRPDCHPETIRLRVGEGEEVAVPGVVEWRPLEGNLEVISDLGLRAPLSGTPPAGWAGARGLRWHDGAFEHVE